jgi:hypothetical protein
VVNIPEADLLVESIIGSQEYQNKDIILLWNGFVLVIKQSNLFEIKPGWK